MNERHALVHTPTPSIYITYARPHVAHKESRRGRGVKPRLNHRDYTKKCKVIRNESAAVQSGFGVVQCVTVFTVPR